jgi:hypothetical protein
MPDKGVKLSCCCKKKSENQFFERYPFKGGRAMRDIKLVSFVVVCCVFCMAEVSIAGWRVRQLTNNNYSDQKPVLTDTMVGWLGRPGAYNQIFVHDGNTGFQLTLDPVTKQDLSGSAAYLAWIDRASPDNVYVYDGNTILPITASGINYRPWVSGDYIVYGRLTNDVMLYNLADHPTTPTQIIAPIGQGGTGNELDPFINGNWVSFTSNEGDSEIYYYDIASDAVTKLTNNGLNDYESVINDGYIGYIHYDGNDREAMLYDRAAAETVQLTNDSVGSSNIFLLGEYCGYVTGESSNAATMHLYNADDESTVTIAGNVSYYYDDRPSAHGDLIAYMGWDGNDWEIFVYSISTQSTTQITNNSYDDRYPRVRGKRIVWQYLDGPDTKSGDYEIMLATYTESAGLFFPIKANNGNAVIIQLPAN